MSVITALCAHLLLFGQVFALIEALSLAVILVKRRDPVDQPIPLAYSEDRAEVFREGVNERVYEAFSVL